MTVWTLWKTEMKKFLTGGLISAAVLMVVLLGAAALGAALLAWLSGLTALWWIMPLVVLTIIAFVIGGLTAMLEK